MVSSRRPTAVALSALLVPVLASCAGEVTSRPISLSDPLGLIDDSDELRLYLMPAETHVCMAATGAVAPMVPDAPVGMTEGAVVDILLTASGGRAMQEVSIPPGSYVALVRGKGTDPTSGVRNTIIATGCAEVIEVAASESRGVAITLNPVISMGVCSDTVLSPDEQCTTPGVGDCSATCQTTPYQLNTTIAMGAQETPRVSGSGSQRALTTFVSERLEVGARVLGPDGRILAMPALLAEDRNVNEVLNDTGFMTLPGVIASASSAVASTGRMAIVTTLVPRAMEFDVRVGFFDTGLAPEGDFIGVTVDAGRQDQIVGAFAGSGAFAAAWHDDAAGIAVRTFASGSRTPSGSASTALDAMGGAPASAGLASGFVVAYEVSGDVMVQRVDAAGAAMGTAVAAFDGAGSQTQPAVAGLSSGGFVVVFTDADVDADGTGIRGVIFDAGGVATADFQVNSTTGGPQSAPSVAAHEDRIAVAWESGGAVRARFLTLAGEGALNRERMPSTSDFELAGGATQPSVAALGAGSTALWLFTYRSMADGLGDIFARRIPR